MTKIGFSLQPEYSLPFSKILALLKEAGFSAVSPVWSPDADFASLASCTQELGLTIQSFHAPHKGIDLLWKPDSPMSREIQPLFIDCIDACARFEVPVMVMHGWQGLLYQFPQTPLNFRFFDSMVEYAQKQGVSIAFENLEGEEYLEALLTRYRNLEHIGFCWDSGHAHCYPHKTDFLPTYGDRLIMTHLNDNWGLRNPDGTPSGNDDLHFLPYDGNIDWETTLDELKNAPLQTILNFEIKVRSHSTAPEDLPYANLPLADFIETAGIRARKIAEQYAAVISGKDIPNKQCSP